VTGSQRGVAPPQLASVEQVPQTCSTQTGPAVEPAQPLPSSHCEQTPSSQMGAERGQAAEPVVQGMAQRRARQTPEVPQSLAAVHSTQRWSVGSQRGNPGAVQWALVAHATHWPALQCMDGRMQSGSVWQGVFESSSKRMSW
jgi:hypothetical protein